jgi:Amt family ammonium transporter
MQTDAINLVNAGDTAWVLVSAALVMLMTPGLAFFYGGMVRRKNVLGILMQCFACLSIISLLWVIYGYSLTFSKGNGFIGGFDALLLKGIGAAPNPDYAGTIPEGAFVLFQMMFAIITPAVLLGSVAERVKFSSFVVFIVLWTTIVYIPICHMAWGIGGFFRNMGVLDFAGGTVVEINSGIAGLVSALYLGKRLGINKPCLHNIPFVILGGALLWFGWFGFNAGSALACNSIAVNAFLTTNTAAAAAALSWALIEWMLSGKPTMFGTITGAVAGLVAVTPAAGFIDTGASILLGAAAGALSFFAVGVMKQRFGYDDSLDVFGVHGVCGFLGMMFTGLFAQKAVNAAGANGLLYGNPGQMLVQLKAALVTIAYCALGTWAICFVVDKLLGMRVSQEEEVMGLDLTQHHERAYTIIE